ncbi:hypothetical protein BS50DRAFT_302741 [Corynespora cassiicola Philippines]|uniref:Uncharacterized protein n=1 Tax=Corynespora cassiicola Philippines TaxID=1448308 RepID=A0A2T2NX70_CORCC|nr:hypothetical protein BS50DRAFT_302741 [Corynespora cassiicola Philippines]
MAVHGPSAHIPAQHIQKSIGSTHHGRPGQRLCTAVPTPCRYYIVRVQIAKTAVFLAPGVGYLARTLYMSPCYKLAPATTIFGVDGLLVACRLHSLVSHQSSARQRGIQRRRHTLQTLRRLPAFPLSSPTHKRRLRRRCERRTHDRQEHRGAAWEGGRGERAPCQGGVLGCTSALRCLSSRCLTASLHLDYNTPYARVTSFLPNLQTAFICPRTLEPVSGMADAWIRIQDHAMWRQLHGQRPG